MSGARTRYDEEFKKNAVALSYEAGLVVQAIKNTMKRWHLPEGTIFHSDWGSQYTSAAVKELLKKHGFLQSYSRVGKPGDNAWSESFFANFKKEAIHWQCDQSAGTSSSVCIYRGFLQHPQGGLDTLAQRSG